MRVILPWQSAQALSPTNVAPSIFGGTTTARPAVEQEFNSNATVPAPKVRAATENQGSILTMGMGFKDLAEERPGKSGFRPSRRLPKTWLD